ncbi:MAG TPA: gluconate 2-dehydrogenase subunit 3 family protein [Mycobacteriales bacterium]
MPYRSPDQVAVTPQHRGRFPGYDVLEEVERWDDVTAGVVLDRLAPVTDLSFFTMDENACAGALCDLLLAQDGEPKIPVVALVDGRLAAGETDGWHYDDLPEDGQAWRDTLRCLDEDAAAGGAASFATAPVDEQVRIVQHVQDLGSDPWHGMPAAQVWSLWTRYACAAFYSHPWSWNEIGFGGPAYPRGYKARHIGPPGREGWEVTDHDDVDPVPFATRVEKARRAHDDLAHGS